MSLTKSDLLAIKGLIQDSERRTIQRIDQLDDTLSMQMANGLSEVHEKIDEVKYDLEGVKTDLQGVKTDLENVKTDLEGVKTDLEGVKTDLDDVKQTVGRIERVQRAEIERSDEQSKTITAIKRKLKLA